MPPSLCVTGSVVVVAERAAGAVKESENEDDADADDADADAENEEDLLDGEPPRARAPLRIVASASAG